MAQRQFRSDDSSVWADRYGNGSDGSTSINTSTDSTANTTITGTAGGTSATAGSGAGFANNNLVLIHQSQGTGVGTWELNKISSVGGGTNWTMAYNLINTYGTGGQVYLLKQYSAVTINSGQTLTGLSWGGSTGGILAFLCSGTITVTGNISVNGANGIVSASQNNAGGGFRGGGGAVNGTAVQGEGETGNGSAVSPPSNNNGSAGGGGKGGTGAGTAGVAFMTVAGLTSHFVFGGSGGGGDENAGTGPAGANGAGIAILIGRVITITGTISSNGGNGVNGSNGRGPSGSGSGGGVLLKGQNITLGSSLVTATGGTSATASGGDPGGPGSGATNGSGTNPNTAGNGAIHADYSGAISGTTNPAIDSRLDANLADSGGSAAFAFM